MTCKTFAESLADPNHPIYGWSKVIVGLIGLTIVLAMNANNFDSSEWKAIGEFALIAFGLQGAHAAVKKLVPHKDEEPKP